MIRLSLSAVPCRLLLLGVEAVTVAVVVGVVDQFEKHQQRFHQVWTGKRRAMPSPASCIEAVTHIAPGFTE